MKQDKKKELADKIDKMEDSHLKERLKKELQTKSKVVQK
jgi:hypothetical protein